MNMSACRFRRFLGVVMAVCLGAVAPGADPPTEGTGPPADTPAIEADAPAVEADAPTVEADAPTVEADAPTVEADAPVAPSRVVVNNGIPAGSVGLNFRGAPLDAVLDHLSEAAGFVIVKEADVQGELDVWSHQPLSLDEVVDLLDTVLNTKGLAAVRSGRTLRIVKAAEAKTYDLPVVSGADPEAIAKSDRMVTQIIPIRYANAKAMLENLQPLLASYASLTANETSNALILTDTHTNVRRIVSIVKALDTSISSVTEVRVFLLEYADAEDLAEVINQVFEIETGQAGGSSSRRARMMEFFMRMRRGGPPGGPPDAPGAENPTTAGGGSQVSINVKAVADTRSNSVVVSAPDDLMDDVETLIKQVDIPVEEDAQLRVFALQYADAEDLAESIEELFNESQTTQQQQRMPFMMRAPMGRSGPGQRGGSGTDDRELLAGEVRAVPDTRTNSVVVTASQANLALIEGMIRELDSTPKNIAQVYVYRIEHADLETLKEMLEGMFEDLEAGSTGAPGTTTGTGQRRTAVSVPTVRR